MPQFYEKMKTRLRTVEEGADTIIWLAIAEAAVKHPSGLFFQGMTSLYYPPPKAEGYRFGVVRPAVRSSGCLDVRVHLSVTILLELHLKDYNRFSHDTSGV